MFQIDTTLYTEAPKTFHCEAEERCFRFLEKARIPFTRIDHDPAETIEICHQIETHLGFPICKNLFLCNRQETDFYLLLMPGDKPFKTKYLSVQIGASRLSFAKPEHMLSLLDVHPGSVTVLSLLCENAGKVRLLIDRNLLGDPYICCHPCVNTSTLKIRAEDIFERFLPAVGHAYTPVELPWTLE